MAKIELDLHRIFRNSVHKDMVEIAKRGFKPAAIEKIKVMEMKIAKDRARGYQKRYKIAKRICSLPTKQAMKEIMRLLDNLGVGD